LIAKRLIVESIYPTHNELREATDEFISSEHPDFLKKFKKNQWRTYYEKNIAQLVSFKEFYVKAIYLHLFIRIKSFLIAISQT
jgi:predicted nucleotidyltransferase